MEKNVFNNIVNAINADEKVIAAKLRNLRVRAGIKLHDFADAIGISEAELSSYENGEEDIPASIIALICAVSGMPYEYFFGEQEELLLVPQNYALKEEHTALLS